MKITTVEEGAERKNALPWLKMGQIKKKLLGTFYPNKMGLNMQKTSHATVPLS